MYYYSGHFAGAVLVLGFHYRETASYYNGSLSPAARCDDAVVVPEEDIADWMRKWDAEDPAYSEYVMSCSYACDRLMQHGRAVFHGASILWREAAYLFSAPSGTGKTTQIRLWKSLFPEEVEILNGDKPVLEICSDGRIQVHPSPWKGKEGYGRDDITAPLAGIILLRQAPENTIGRMKPAEAARDLFGRIYSNFTTREDVLNAAGIMEMLAGTVPVWLLRNKGDEDSAGLAYRTLREKEDKD